MFLLFQNATTIDRSTSLTDRAAEALASVARNKPDVIVSDIGMPEANRYAFIRSLRALWPTNLQPWLRNDEFLLSYMARSPET
jgi:DNA-binding NarL/FixJ family response regulator